MPRLENWFFCKKTYRDNYKIIPPPTNVEESIFLWGEVYDSSEFEDGTSVTTSLIVELKSDSAITQSNTPYTYGEMHPDYKELVDAIKDGIPVIEKWSISGNLRQGYSISGKILNEDNREISGIIQDQNGNFLTVDGTKYLILWKNFSYIADPEFKGNEYLDLRVLDDFDPYLGFEYSRPRLMTIHGVGPISTDHS